LQASAADGKSPHGPEEAVALDVAVAEAVAGAGADDAGAAASGAEQAVNARAETAAARVSGRATAGRMFFTVTLLVEIAPRGPQDRPWPWRSSPACESSPGSRRVPKAGDPALEWA